MLDRSSKIDQVRLFIKNLQPIYMQHMQFAPFENFTTPRNMGTLVEKELAREAQVKTGSN